MTKWKKPIPVGSPEAAAIIERVRKAEEANRNLTADPITGKRRKRPRRRNYT